MELARAASEIFRQTLRSIEVERVIERVIRREGQSLRIAGEEIQADPLHPVVVVAIGKAALPMAAAAGRILGDLLTAGIIATNESPASTPTGFELFTGGHPVPNEESLAAAAAAIELLQRYDDDRTLLLFLISGGGSALFERPIAGAITLADLQEVNRVLVGCGAVIGEMNIVRRFLSAVKGGRLAEVASRARQISLLISDVRGLEIKTPVTF
ncbi:MAG: glycerate-2-kinase family protein, partial [Blastocatellia bacterium]